MEEALTSIIGAMAKISAHATTTADIRDALVAELQKLGCHNC